MAMAGKDLTLLLRDKAGFFFVFFFPLIYAVFFGAIFSGGGSGGMSALEVAVVDEDGSDLSQKFIDKLEAAKELSLLPTDREQAHALVKKGDRVAYLVIPEGFGSSAFRLFQGESLSLELRVDASRKAEAGLLQGVITQYSYQVLQEMFFDRDTMRAQVRQAAAALQTNEEMDDFTKGVLQTFFGALDTFVLDIWPEEEEVAEADASETDASTRESTPDSALAMTDADKADNESGESAAPGWQPVKIEIQSVGREQKANVPKTSYDITMPQAFVWVFLGCAAAFGVSLVTERTRGTLMRLRSAPITLGQILAGKAMACFITIMAALVMLLLFFTLVFGVRAGSYPNLALAFVSATFAFVGVMMLISVLGKTEASAGGVGWALLLVMAMTGGGMVPLMFLPGWMKTVSHFSFVKWAVLAIEGAVWRGFTFQEMLMPCGILIAIGLVAFSLGVGVFRATVD